MTLLARFWSDDRGSDTLESLALLALIVLPLTAFLLSNRATYYQGMSDHFGNVMNAGHPGPID